MSASVLIVDDSLTVRMDLAEAFGAAGFRALPCANAEQARKLLSAEQIDLVILDVVLPDADGIELLGEVRSITNSKVPVLMLSSEAEVSHRIRGLKTGADEYVGKPYDVGYVIAKARQLLRARKALTGDAKPILLIDDSLTFRTELRRALEASGHLVVATESGEEGLRIAAGQRPSAVIVDGVLPGIDGPTVIRHIRLDAALRGVPCVLLTGAREIDAELRALDSGADAFVHKDEDLAVILAKLHAVLRAAADTKPDEQTASLLAPKRILAVDDSATYREMLASTLRSDGYDVILVPSGEDAIELLAVQRVDCILLDLMMPGLGGQETCRRLKTTPGVRDIPIIVLTGVEDRGSMLEGLAVGADDYIQKSAEFEVLKARLRAQLRRRQFEEETRRVREQLLRSELEASEARGARELAETRAALVEELELKNREIEGAYRELQTTQARLLQSAKMASLGELVAGIAHEINNPLAFAVSHLNTARRSLAHLTTEIGTGVSDSGREHWQRAENRLSEMAVGLNRISDLVVKLRTFSRLDEGERAPASMRECVGSLLTILGHRLQQGVKVETRFGELDDIECFPSLINQALMNLVANAIDAMEGRGQLTISTGSDGATYSIVVADTGPGIPEELRERVLEPFFTTKPVGAGTGLGLAITYSIVRRHHGTLEFRDAEGGGTAATIRIPLSFEAEE